MGKKKNAQALAAAAGSSGSADDEDIRFLKARNVMLMKEVKDRRKEIQHLQHRIATAKLELTVAAGKKNAAKRELNHLSNSSQMKAKNATAGGVLEAAESSESKEIKNLKALNDQLVQDVAERRKQIGRLRLELDTLTADHDILSGMMREVLGLVLSSTLNEAAARKNAEIAAAARKNAEIAAFRKKAQSASSKLNATKTLLLDLAGEKDAIQKDMERIVEERNSTLLSLEQAKNHPEQYRRTWKKWIYPVAVASFSVATAIVILCKGSNVKN